MLSLMPQVVLAPTDDTKYLTLVSQPLLYR